MPTKRPCADADGGKKKPKQETDAGQISRKQAGFKDVALLASSLAPHVKKRFAVNYTCDRGMKQLDKKKLVMPFFGKLVG